jgi:hypothetical protein
MILHEEAPYDSGFSHYYAFFTGYEWSWCMLNFAIIMIVLIFGSSEIHWRLSSGFYRIRESENALNSAD